MHKHITMHIKRQGRDMYFTSPTYRMTAGSRATSAMYRCTSFTDERHMRAVASTPPSDTRTIHHVQHRMEPQRKSRSRSAAPCDCGSRRGIGKRPPRKSALGHLRSASFPHYRAFCPHSALHAATLSDHRAHAAGSPAGRNLDAKPRDAAAELVEAVSSANACNRRPQPARTAFKVKVLPRWR
jgi:hypothetical protein